MANTGDILLDNRTFIQVLRDIVGSCTYQFNTHAGMPDDKAWLRQKKAKRSDECLLQGIQPDPKNGNSRPACSGQAQQVQYSGSSTIRVVDLQLPVSSLWKPEGINSPIHTLQMLIACLHDWREYPNFCIPFARSYSKYQIMKTMVGLGNHNCYFGTVLTEGDTNLHSKFLSGQRRKRRLTQSGDHEIAPDSIQLVEKNIFLTIEMLIGM